MAARSTRKIEEEQTIHYVSERKKRAKPGSKMQPPLTPMIDVTFQLLIYFILTTTFRVAEGQIPGNLPTAMGLEQQQEVVDTEPVTLRVIPHGQYLEEAGFVLDGESETRKPEELHALLERRLASLGGKPQLVIEARYTVAWQHVVEAYNQAVRAEWQKIGIRGPQ
ncbi:MAG: ExbD/TolR family protein [Phycisphaerae bacterium]